MSFKGVSVIDQCTVLLNFLSFFSVGMLRFSGGAMTVIKRSNDIWLWVLKMNCRREEAGAAATLIMRCGFRVHDNDVGG